MRLRKGIPLVDADIYSLRKNQMQSIPIYAAPAFWSLSLFQIFNFILKEGY
jgi:hypothetical protein